MSLYDVWDHAISEVCKKEIRKSKDMNRSKGSASHGTLVLMLTRWFACRRVIFGWAAGRM